MNQRRRSIALFAALAAGTLLLLAFYGPLGSTLSCPRRLAAHTTSRVVERVVASVVRSVARGIATPAWAQQTLDFKPVPPESVTRLEARTARRAAPAPPAAPEPRVSAPIPPEPAEPDSDLPSVGIIAGKGANLVRMGSDIHVARGEVVDGDVSAVRGNVIVEGHVKGGVSAIGGDVYLKSTARVDGDVVCVSGELHEEAGASVGGERFTMLGGSGRPFRTRVGRVPMTDEDDVRPRHHWVGHLIFFLIMLGLVWAFAKLAPGRTGGAVDSLKREPGAALVTGLLFGLFSIPGFIAVALLAAILCITIIGIPVAIVALLAYPSVLIVVWAWGFAVGVTAIGEQVLSRRAHSVSGAALQPPMPGAPPLVTIDRAALYGAAVVGGAMLVNAILHATGFGPFRAIGTLLGVLAWITTGIAGTLGTGAWLRAEHERGTFSRWWNRRRAPYPPAAPPPPPPAPATPQGATGTMQTWSPAAPPSEPPPTVTP